MMIMIYPSLDDIRAAHGRILPYIHKTPVLSSTLINRMFDSEIYLKCENFQKIGAFKYRGATNAVLQLDEGSRRKGVVTHSSGNHAAALTLAAASTGVKAYIVMPDNAPEVKKNAVAGYGADITFCTPTLKAREDTTAEIIRKTGATLIHSYDDFNVICGQGTAGLELIQEKPDLDMVIVPIGGGGLMSGISTAVKGLSGKVKVIGAEPLNASDAYRSFISGSLVPSVNPQTIADGLLTSLSDMTFSIIKRNVDNIYTVSEESIIKAMQLIWERMKIIVEPSSATALAVILENPGLFRGKSAGLIITGGNVDLGRLPFAAVS